MTTPTPESESVDEADAPALVDLNPDELVALLVEAEQIADEKGDD